ncbi:MAG: thymidylate synthase complementing protein ThyX family protein [Microgenomates group bacterium Gr01-1014_5]|nr:MAG: thymidylate synthase complementing protein ThyX family protein [Microgenomates group bacterium Gr01-1014_5]
MSIGPGGPEQLLRERHEGLVVPESPVLVTPWGFLPEIKQRLLDSVEARAVFNSEQVGGIKEALTTAATRFGSGLSELPEFLDTMRRLEEYVRLTGEGTEAEREYVKHVMRTDEEIAVIFARISRNPGSIEENSRSVTEEGAAQFHQKWTVSVDGYGHESVAEHAIIREAVENAPSLDVDYVTDNRLASLTEFSGRFKGRQGVGHFTPDSVSRDPHLNRRWQEVHALVFGFHDMMMEKGAVYIQTDEAKGKHPRRKLTTKVVADQVKNLMPASRLSSVTITMNAREAENVFRKLLSSPHPSVNRLGQVMKEHALRVAPTLVKYADRNDFLVASREGIGALVERERLQGDYPDIREGKSVDLYSYDPEADAKFLAAATYHDPDTGNWRDLVAKFSAMTVDQKEAALLDVLGKMGKFDKPIRAIEMPSDYVVEYPGMTYGTWRDYKRHRMEYYEAKDLDTRFGYEVPPLFTEMDESADSQFHGCVKSLHRVMGEVDKLFREVRAVDSYAAQYCVTRLHYRPAIAKFNVREAFHLINLRTSGSAIPFIRTLMWDLFDQLKEANPLIMKHLQLKLEARPRPERDFPWSV